MIRPTMQICLKNMKSHINILISRGFILLVPAALIACAGYGEQYRGAINNTLRPYRPNIIQGNFISKEQVSRIKLGMDREEVKVILGTPLLASNLHTNRWDYVFVFKKGSVELVEQRRVTILFDKDKVVEIKGGEDLPSEYELIAEIDGLKSDAGVKKNQKPVPTITPKDGAQVQTIPNPSSAVAVPADKKN